MRHLFALAIILLSFLAGAEPSIVPGSVSMKYSVGSRAITVRFQLSADEKAVVTTDIVRADTGVSIGEAMLAECASGDFNCRIAAGATGKVVFTLPESFGDFNPVEHQVRIRAWSLSAPPEIMVANLVTSNVCFYASTNALPYEGLSNPTGLFKTACLVLRRIPAAGIPFRVGSPTTEIGRSANEVPRIVTLSGDYYMGIYEVTQYQWEKVMGTNSSLYKEADRNVHPAEEIAFAGWIDTVRGGSGTAGNPNYYSNFVTNWPHGSQPHQVGDNGFLAKLRKRLGISGFEAPTEAQWEFACRGGCGFALYNGGEMSANGTACAAQNEIAWSSANAGGVTREVGLKAPNAFGLYDMIGNVWEWCIDAYTATPQGGIDYPGSTASTETRVLRGGAVHQTADANTEDYSPNFLRSAARFSYGCTSRRGNIGFRLCCPATLEY